MDEIENQKEQAWIVAIVRFFFFTFQCASCYFVLLIVILRMSIVRNPLEFDKIHEKITNPSCIVIWCIVVILNAMPVLMGSPAVVQEISKRTLTYTMVLHLGVTLPLLLAIFCNLFLSLYLTKSVITASSFSKQEEKRRKAFQKLINGLVIWLIVCNVPYIIWVHYSLNCMIVDHIPWVGIEGVIVNQIIF